MAYRAGAPETWALRVSRAIDLWHAQAPRPAASSPLPLSRPLRASSPRYRLCVRQPGAATTTHHHGLGYLRWKHVVQNHPGRGVRGGAGRKGWLCRASQARQRLGLHTSALCLNASTSRWSAGLGQYMARFRNTLDSVSKAVGAAGAQTEFLSKIARLKPNTAAAASQLSKEVESKSLDAKPKAEETTTTTVETTTTIPTLNHPLPPIPAVTQTPTSTVSDTTPPTPTLPDAATPDASTTTSVPNRNAARETAQVTVATPPSPPAAPNVREKRLRRVVHASAVKTKAATQVSEGIKTPPPSPNGSETRKAATSPKPAAAATQQLFHPSTFSVNLDDTYNYLSHHINAYFSSNAKADEKKTESAGGTSSVPAPGQQTKDLVQVSNTSVPSEPAATSAPPTSHKKGIGHYLSYSAPSVQAFVGSYIAPLVPKFRAAESKPTEEKTSEDAPEKQSVPEVVVTTEQKAAEEKAKRLLLQREKIIARVSVDNRTRALVQSLGRASDVKVYTSRVEDFSYHLMEFPETRGVAVKAKVIPCLLRLRQATDPGLRAAVREALTLVGYNDPVKGRGVRVLTIDGGGLRGLVALQTLHRLESLTGKRIFQLFDYICGVSTGAILGFMLGVFQLPLSECDDLYRKLGSDVFKQNVIVGTVKMGWSHAFYDSEAWENILKERMGADLMVETSRDPNCPKVAAVSTIVNRGLPLKAYVFRNYSLLPGVRSHYLGGCQHQLWQAVRASSAAPGYFQEFTLGNDLHQDGGLLINNPTALALHECKCLWPNTPVECVVSLGTGRFESPGGKQSTTYTSLKTKITNIISSATDTEEVHTMLDALLPPDTYFRFNPYMNEEIALDESRHEKLDLLQAEGLRYLDRNEPKLRKAAAILTREKGSVQRLADWARLKAHMFDSPT